MQSTTAFRQKFIQRLMSIDFDPRDLAVKIGEKNYLNPISQYGKDGRKKYVTDFDGIYESGEALYKLFWFKYAEKINSAINGSEIDKFIQSIFRGTPIKEVFKGMTEYLKSDSIRFTQRQYYDACKAAGEEWQPNPDARRAIGEIRRMGYDIIVISGSPQEALEIAAKKIGIEKRFGDKIIGAEFEFDEITGDLTSIHSMLREDKLVEKIRILNKEKHVAVTDDMQTDDLITLGAALSIIIADKDGKTLQNEEQIYIFDKSIRQDFNLMLKYLKRYDYAVPRAANTSESREGEIMELVQKIKKPKSSEEFLEAIEFLGRKLEIFNPFASIERIVLLLDYKNADTEKQKNLKQGILSVLDELPEYKHTEAFAELLKVEA